MEVKYKHIQSAHCENGAIVNLFNFHGIQISEPMAFGIGAGLFFGYMPFLKVNNLPVTTYRILPGQIFKRVAQRLGLGIKTEKFSDPNKGMEALDRSLDKGFPVGLITSVFYLPYLPEAYRFHFNAHNIVVYGKENEEYLVSDSVLDFTSKISRKDLLRARFAKGTLSPKGRMYYPLTIPDKLNWQKAIVKGIKTAAKQMTGIPVPLFGVKGIRLLSRRLELWPQKLGDRKAAQYLGNIIRMQEEIGTGGAGFRFIFAAFVQESSRELQKPELYSLSAEMTQIGDLWREFAIAAARICKDRPNGSQSYKTLSEMLNGCAEKEERLFEQLGSMNLIA